jgi:opacity protein-like surface antigen
MMNRLLLLLLMCAAPMFAFGQLPSGAIYGGYQHMRVDTTSEQEALNLAAYQAGVSPINLGRHQNAHGWNFGVQENFNSWFGGVVDVGGAYVTKKITVVQAGGLTTQLRARIRFYTFTAGPQFAYSGNHTFQPFVRGLVGGGFSNTSANVLVNNVPQFSELRDSDTSFALGGGAGTDIRFANYLAVRVAADYFRTYLFSEAQNNLRGTVSLVYRWGEAGK